MVLQSQGLRQVQKQTQNLVLAPQLRQSLKILQVPTLELRSAILEELQTNPLLEEIGSNDESLDSNEVEPSPDELQEQDAEEFPDDAEGPKESENSEENDFDLDSNNAEDISDMDFSDEFAILKGNAGRLKRAF
jgi:RNA polymerase sigma-54 factor